MGCASTKSSAETKYSQGTNEIIVLTLKQRLEKRRPPPLALTEAQIDEIDLSVAKNKEELFPIHQRRHYCYMTAPKTPSPSVGILTYSQSREDDDDDDDEA
eukprot:PhM_4_TR12753/c0_g1_i1/m.27764